MTAATEGTAGADLPMPPVAREGSHLDLVSHSMVEQARLLRDRTISSKDLVVAYLERIQELDEPDGLNSYISIAPEQAIDEAVTLDRAAANGHVVGPLHGIPLTVKDVLDVQGHVTTGGTISLRDHVAAADANVIAGIRAAGAIILGKSNLHEACGGVTSDNPHFGKVRNPFDPSRIAGGSSGGTAAAVAGLLASGGIGTDTGASVRLPASFCGLVGIRPTVGTTSLDGVLAQSWTCDAIGPITRTLDDTSLLLRGMGVLRTEKEGWLIADQLRIGVLGDIFAEGNHPSVDAAMTDTFEHLENMANLRPMPADWATGTVELSFRIVGPETIVLTERYLETVQPRISLDAFVERLSDGVRQVFTRQLADVPDRTSAVSYLRAIGYERELLRRRVEGLFNEVDVLALPTALSPAIPFEQGQTMDVGGQTRPTFETLIRNTAWVGILGLPAISIPIGASPEGLPIGLQLVGRRGADGTVISVARSVSHAVSPRCL